MKKFFVVALMSVMLVCVACGNEKSAEQSAPAEPKKIDAVLVAGSFWVIESENMPYLTDALTRKDTEYLRQLMLEGKVFHVDKDTKVTRFGVAADKNNVLILFKEGRYTNKTGCTYVSSVIAEKDYSSYLESQRHAKLALIRDSLTSTEKYLDIIASGNVKEVEQFSSYCLSKTNELKSFRQEQEIEREIIEQAEMAINIIFQRDSVLWDYRHLVEYTQKIEQGGKNSISDRRMQEHYRDIIKKDSQEAEKLRQEFKTKYGY